MAKFKDLYSKVKNTAAYKTSGILMEVAYMIQAAMDHKGMAKTELANELGCSRAYLTKALRGDNNFSISSLSKMAKALDCELHVAMIPRVVYTEVIKSAEKFYAQMQEERINSLRHEVKKKVKQKEKVVSIQEWLNNESINLAA
ncbi:helix-turn-helix domain-containing protein [Simiduia aestuariiviva]|uniref:Transcriptional regulator with XRE-family HTH domain n=1 Tax=Simiduia aestuariiviva TaxID=1510459 RepID=A0A839UUN0_9GAMM|nr:helix-turn-helix transcriptional regulator [Simiduia aestuariiviva]MBB3170150.1 transcriptional regulator with XRE-family HTH domain [Simiduia aestuariiviva]